MKQHFRRFSVLCILAAMILCFQIPWAAAEDWMVCASSDVDYQGLRYYTYNRHGQVVSEINNTGDWRADIVYYPDGRIKSRTERSTYSTEVWRYDERGRKTEDPDNTYQYLFNSGGKLTGMNVISKDGRTRGEYRYQYYSDNTIRLTYTNVSTYGGRRDVMFVVTIDFDDYGYVTATCREGELYGKKSSIYSYDGSFNLTYERTWYQNGQFSSDIITSYENTYNQSGYLTSVHSITDSSTDGRSYHSVIYNYDSKGNLIKKTDSHYSQSEYWRYNSDGYLTDCCELLPPSNDPLDEYIWGTGEYTFANKHFTYAPLSQLLAK